MGGEDPRATAGDLIETNKAKVVAITKSFEILSLGGDRVSFQVSRRKQFEGICHDILGTFGNRYNDLDGYWALGQYVAFLNRLGERQLQFRLRDSTVVPDSPSAALSAEYYRRTRLAHENLGCALQVSNQGMEDRT
ncbi:hypothetical protein CN234_36295 [Sinorhizobium meliloti]|nr:hypothetical protein CN234_36295 [Sinorhizobium meliloti]